MLNLVEKGAARLGYYSFLFALLIFVGNLLSIFNIPDIVPILVVILSAFLLILSFSTFQWQSRSQVSKKRLFWSVFFFLFIFYIPINLAFLSVGMVELKLHDFGAYYNAAVRWLHYAPLYQTTYEVSTLEAQISGSMPYLYPPMFVLIFVPFTLFPPIIAGIIWDVVILAFLIFSVSRLVSAFEVDFSWRKRLLLYLVIASFAPTITWMKLGQVSGLITALLCLSGATLRSNRHELSGAFTALGSLVKPFYAPSGAHLLRNQRRFVSALITSAAVIILGLLIFGIETHLEYIDVLREGGGWLTPLEPNNWHATHFNPFYIFGPAHVIFRVFIISGTAGLALYSNKTKVPIEYIFALGVSIVPLAGPTNTLALNAAIPAILITVLYELENGREFPIVLAICALLIHIHPYTIEFLSKFGPQLYPSLELLTPAIPLLQPALYGMTLLVGYITYRSVKNPI